MPCRRGSRPRSAARSSGSSCWRDRSGRSRPSATRSPPRCPGGGRPRGPPAAAQRDRPGNRHAALARGPVSDLRQPAATRCLCRAGADALAERPHPARAGHLESRQPAPAHGDDRARLALATAPARRSEEHTSELQSRQYLVCRLLLEKKKDRNLSATPTAKPLTKHTLPLLPLNTTRALVSYPLIPIHRNSTYS